LFIFTYMKKKETLILYFPGFGSNLESRTYKELLKYFPSQVKYITYDDHDPDKAQSQIESQMESLIDEHHDIFIVGTSLGGYWANFAACKYKLPAILVNPSLYPGDTLGHYGVSSEMLKKYKKSNICNIPRTIFLGKKDEILDPKVAESEFVGKNKIVWLEEGHQISNFDPIIEELKFQINNVQEF
jgi:predicted esterase YcpF (UPF0227 family)